MRTSPLMLCALLASCPALAPDQAHAQDVAPRVPVTAEASIAVTKNTIAPEDLSRAVVESVHHLLAGQEGEPKAQWPYEGVYRVRGEIPIGYRIGGTAICAGALVLAPGYADDDERKAAVDRAVEFICRGIEHPLMSATAYDGGYDVRCWGYIYALDFLCLLKEQNLIPEARADAVAKATAFYLASLHTNEMPATGGWNYARPEGIETVGAPSPFTTAPALQALFRAKRAGFEVDPGVVDRALAFLEKAKAASGAVVYSGEASKRMGRSDATPGAVGRMLVTESTLLLAGKSTPANVRACLDAFISHWDWLNQRRAKTGTHVGPYAVAPYYFMYAHRYAAQAIELLPSTERAEYRRRVNLLLFSVRDADGSWNDRVFKRSSNFGTAMAALAILEPSLGPAPTWPTPSPAPAPAPTPPDTQPAGASPAGVDSDR